MPKQPAHPPPSTGEGRTPDSTDSAGLSGAAQFAARYYDYADSQMALSLRQRDSTVLLYLGAIATLFGTALTQTPIEISLIALVPILSLGATMISMLHHVRIGALSTFREKLHAWILSNISSSLPSHMDSIAMARDAKTPRLYEIIIQANQILAHFILLQLPALVAALIVTAAETGPRPVPIPFGMEQNGRIVLITSCWLCFMISLAVLVTSLLARRRLYGMQKKLAHFSSV